MNNFSDIVKVNGIIKSYLDKANYNFHTDNPIPDQLKIFYSFKSNAQDIVINVGIIADSPYKIEIVSVINFSSKHIEVLKENPKNVKEKMLNEIFMWMVPREPQYAINLNEDRNFVDSHFMVINPIYEGDLSFSKFMTSIDRTIRGTLLIKRIIQGHLNKHIKGVEIDG